MSIEDRALPAVVHLTGDDAHDVLGAAVTSAGGDLHAVRVSQVQYRPGSDLVVRYRADITWPGADRRDETIFAACRAGAAHTDAIPVVAETEDGTLEVSVWRWPHDPVLPGLPVATTGHLLRDALAGADPVLAAPSLAIDVVAFRPTERAVARASTDAGTRYVKVVPPASLPAIVERHHRLGAAGLPVPAVVATHDELGLLVMDELAGTTLRDRIKGGLDPWARISAIDDLLQSLSDVPVDDLPPATCRLRDALGHSRLLVTVAPRSAPVLDRIGAVVRAELDASRGTTTFVHGDLHEAQLVVDEHGEVTGLLDIDDVGTGHPLADRSTLLGHLRFRAVTAADEAQRWAVDAFADDLRASTPEADRRALDVRTAAVLVGLATGPFRIQRPGWQDEVASVLARAEVLATTDEELLNSASRSPQDRPSSWEPSTPRPAKEQTSCARP